MCPTWTTFLIDALQHALRLAHTDGAVASKCPSFSGLDCCNIENEIIAFDVSLNLLVLPCSAWPTLVDLACAHMVLAPHTPLHLPVPKPKPHHKWCPSSWPADVWRHSHQWNSQGLPMVAAVRSLGEPPEHNASLWLPQVVLVRMPQIQQWPPFAAHTSLNGVPMFSHLWQSVQPMAASPRGHSRALVAQWWLWSYQPW